MIAVMRFQLGGYLRSVRALHPVLALALLVAVVFSAPLGAGTAEIRQGALTALGDLATMTFPISAWAARGLLDTEPDAQRHVTAVTAGRWRALAAGPLAVYGFAAVLALLAPVYPMAEGARYGLAPSTLLLAVALTLASTLAATVLGALTSRAVIPSPGASILVLLGVCGANLLLGIGPLRVLTVPMIEWMRAAAHGPAAFAAALPALLLRTVAWAAVAALLYARLRRHRA